MDVIIFSFDHFEIHAKLMNTFGSTRLGILSEMATMLTKLHVLSIKIIG